MCCETPRRGAGGVQEKQDCSGAEVHSASQPSVLEEAIAMAISIWD